MMFTSFLTYLLMVLATVSSAVSTLWFGPTTIQENRITAEERAATTTMTEVVSQGGGETTATTTAKATTSPKKPVAITPIPKVTPEPKPVTETRPPETTTVTLPFLPPIQAPPLPTSFTSINTSVRNALVNILCTTKNGTLNPISGSGLMISPNGVILTNAHVAQYFLLKDYGMPNFIECTARIGSPARNTYTLELLYISPEWVAANKNTLVEQNPTGTGEHDFALLHVTGRTDSSLSVSYPLPFIAPEIREPAEGTNVLVAAYPAGFLGGVSIQKDLYSASALSTVKKIFTFDLDRGTADLMSVGGTVIAQKGSSGGTVVNANGDAVGLVVTSTDAEKTEDRDLRAVTLAHVNRELSENAGVTLDGLLKSNLSAYAKTFNSVVAPALTKMLIDVINR